MLHTCHNIYSIVYTINMPDPMKCAPFSHKFVTNTQQKVIIIYFADCT